MQSSDNESEAPKETRRRTVVIAVVNLRLRRDDVVVDDVTAVVVLERLKHQVGCVRSGRRPSFDGCMVHAKYLELQRRMCV